MEHGDITGLLATFGTFGGVALIIWTSVQAKIARIKAEAQVRRMGETPLPDSSVMAELKALRQQMAEMSSTSHQFDISFDAALNRLEERVSRVETKVAVTPSTSAQTEEVQRVGLR